MILESRTTDAIQKYGIEKVNAIIQRDNALCCKYILPICRYVYDEKNDINEVLPVIRMVDKTQGIDIYSLSFDELRNQLNVNKPDDYIPLPNPFYFSSDKTVEIGHITSWDESKEIPQAKSWCISRKEESWDDFVKNRGYRFFIIRDSKCFYKKNARHVIVSVAKNGSWWFVDSDDDTMVDYHIGTERTDNHMLKSDYIKSIGEGAMKAIQDKITTNENKRYKNMNRKNTIRLTESELKGIIIESVRQIVRTLNEEKEDHSYKPIGPQTFYTNNGKIERKSIVTLQSPSGQVCHIAEDDHCYVLFNGSGIDCGGNGLNDKNCEMIHYIFPEAFKVLKELPLL